MVLVIPRGLLATRPTRKISQLSRTIKHRQKLWDSWTRKIRKLQICDANNQSIKVIIFSSRQYTIVPKYSSISTSLWACLLIITKVFWAMDKYFFKTNQKLRTRARTILPKRRIQSHSATNLNPNKKTQLQHSNPSSKTSQWTPNPTNPSHNNKPN